MEYGWGNGAKVIALESKICYHKTNFQKGRISMENIRYQNLLIDAEVWATTGDFAKVNQLIKPYNYIAIASNSSIETATIYEWMVLLGRIVKGETLTEFLRRHQQLEDLDKWLYVSQSLQNIYIMQQNHMDCCFVNNGINDCMDVSCAHEIRDISNLQKILK